MTEIIDTMPPVYHFSVEAYHITIYSIEDTLQSNFVDLLEVRRAFKK